MSESVSERVIERVGGWPHSQLAGAAQRALHACDEEASIVAPSSPLLPSPPLPSHPMLSPLPLSYQVSSGLPVGGMRAPLSHPQQPVSFSRSVAQPAVFLTSPALPSHTLTSQQRYYDSVHSPPAPSASHVLSYPLPAAKHESAAAQRQSSHWEQQWVQQRAQQLHHFHPVQQHQQYVGHSSSGQHYAGEAVASPAPRNGLSRHSELQLHEAANAVLTSAAAASSAQQAQQQLAQLAALRLGQHTDGRLAMIAAAPPPAHLSHTTQRSHMHTIEQAQVDLLAALNHHQQHHQQQHQHQYQQQQQQQHLRQPARNGTVASHKRARLSAPPPAPHLASPIPMHPRAHAVSQPHTSHALSANHTSPLISSMPPFQPHAHTRTHTHTRPHTHSHPQHTPHRNTLTPQSHLVAPPATALRSTGQLGSPVIPRSSPPALLTPVAPVTPFTAHFSSLSAASVHSSPPARHRAAPTGATSPSSSRSSGRRYTVPTTASELNSASPAIAATLIADTFASPPVVPLTPLAPVAPLTAFTPLAALGSLAPVAPLGPTLPRPPPAGQLSVAPLSSPAVVPLAPVRPLSPPPPPLLLFDCPSVGGRRRLSHRLRCAVTAAQLLKYVDLELEEDGHNERCDAAYPEPTCIWRPSVPASAATSQTCLSPSFTDTALHTTRTCGCGSSNLEVHSGRLCAGLLSLYSIALSLPSDSARTAGGGATVDGWQHVLSAAAAAVNGPTLVAQTPASG